ncbi:hypothetical protein GCM10022202_36810 [Microbacterium marinilacus]|uniref:Uncharacterized protein n=1 Tax=Microbacterium marinilacus TaxID=415209 RepID=A0ABP7BVT7_9MICO
MRARGGSTCRVDEGAQVALPGRIEIECSDQRVDDLDGGDDAPALFEPRVVVGGHARQQRDLLAAETRHAARAAIGQQPGLLGVAVRAGVAEELPELAVRIAHGHILPTPRADTTRETGSRAGTDGPERAVQVLRTIRRRMRPQRT